MADEKQYFWDGLLQDTPDGPALVAHRCKTCGKNYFPATTLCNNCLGEEFEPFLLPRQGKLYTHTVTAVPVGKFKPPHAMGHILFEQDQVRVFSPLVADEQVKYGDTMEVFEDILWEKDDGTPVWGYRFRKAQG